MTLLEVDGLGVEVKRYGKWVEVIGRPETVIALLACSRDRYICCPSLHRDHTVGEIVTLLKRMRAVLAVSQG